MTHHILIITAVKEESFLLASQVTSFRSGKLGGREMISGCLCGMPVRLLVCGPGQVNTVQAMTAAISSETPAMIVQTGCAGGFEQAGVHIGDIAIASEEIDAHLGIEPQGPELPVESLPFAIGCYQNAEIKNRYPANAELAKKTMAALREEKRRMAGAVMLGPFITVSTITATDRRAAQYYEAYGVLMESMEGAGAAHVALHYGIPFLEIRAAANRVGKRERDAWNLPLAFEKSQAAVMTLFTIGVFS